MSLTYDIDKAASIVVLTGGDITLSEFCHVVGDVVADPRFDASFSFLIDCRAATRAPSAVGVRGVVEFIARNAAAHGDARWAFVVARPAGFGMGRMAEVLGDEAGLRLRVFRTMEEARGWLG